MLDVAAIAIGVVLALMLVSAVLGIAACMHSSGYSQMEERIRGKLEG